MVKPTDKPFWPKIVRDEFLDLATALADQANHRNVGGGVARQHGKQHRLADAGRRKNTHALAVAAGQEGIDGADAKIELAAHPLPFMRRRRLSAEFIADRATPQRTFAVDRLTKGVDNSTEPGAFRKDRRLLIAQHDAAAKTNTIDWLKRHEQRLTVSKADHLARNPAPATRDHIAARPDRERTLQARALDQYAKHGRDPTIELDRGNPIDFSGDSKCSAVHQPSHKRVQLWPGDIISRPA